MDALCCSHSCAIGIWSLACITILISLPFSRKREEKKNIKVAASARAIYFPVEFGVFSQVSCISIAFAFCAPSLKQKCCTMRDTKRLPAVKLGLHIGAALLTQTPGPNEWKSDANRRASRKFNRTTVSLKTSSLKQWSRVRWLLCVCVRFCFSKRPRPTGTGLGSGDSGNENECPI